MTRKDNSSVLLAVLAKKSGQFFGTLADTDTRCRVPVPHYSLLVDRLFDVYRESQRRHTLLSPIFQHGQPFQLAVLLAIADDFAIYLCTR